MVSYSGWMRNPPVDRSVVNLPLLGFNIFQPSFGAGFRNHPQCVLTCRNKQPSSWGQMATTKTKTWDVLARVIQSDIKFTWANVEYESKKNQVNKFNNLAIRRFHNPYLSYISYHSKLNSFQIVGSKSRRTSTVSQDLDLLKTPHCRAAGAKVRSPISKAGKVTSFTKPQIQWIVFCWGKLEQV